MVIYGFKQMAIVIEVSFISTFADETRWDALLLALTEIPGEV